jgi:pimeloyl-ACP methyl ester carboxylesterase
LKDQETIMVSGVRPDYIEVRRKDGPPWRIARRLRPAGDEGKNAPGIVWLGGFASDMNGSKASFVDAQAAAKGRSFLRFDYSGHGESAFEAEGGRFEDGAIGDWLEQSLTLFCGSTEGPQIVVGTSMGAWIALLLARRLAELGQEGRLRALVLLAPAVDFTEALLWPSLSEAARSQIAQEGVYLRPSAYSPRPLSITRRLIEDGRAHLLLGGPVRSFAPVHILQGLRDEDVPWRHAFGLAERLAEDPVTVSLVADGDHRLSRPQDLDQLAVTIFTF